MAEHNGETVTIEVSDESVAAEVALGIIGRAQDLHESPGDDNEDVAIELRDIGNDLLKAYELPR